MEYDNAIGYWRKEMKMNKVVYEIMELMVDHDQESGLGLAWRPTGPDVRPTNSTPEPVYVGVGACLQQQTTYVL